MSKRRNISQREAHRLLAFKNGVFNGTAGTHFSEAYLLRAQDYEVVRMAQAAGAVILVTTAKQNHVNIRVLTP